MKQAGFEFKEHTADVKVQSWGKTLEEAYSQAAYGLMTTITPNLELIDPQITRTIELKAEDLEALLFDFLSEFLFLFDVDELIFNIIEVESIIKDNNSYKLKASLIGEKFNLKKHEIGTEVKAVTYSFISIEEKRNKVIINIVFDI